MYDTHTHTRTEPDAAVLQQVAEMVKHGFLVLAADPAEVTEETTTVGHHLGKGDFLQKSKCFMSDICSNIFNKVVLHAKS